MRFSRDAARGGARMLDWKSRQLFHSVNFFRFPFYFFHSFFHFLSPLFFFLSASSLLPFLFFLPVHFDRLRKEIQLFLHGSCKTYLNRWIEQAERDENLEALVSMHAHRALLWSNRKASGQNQKTTPKSQNKPKYAKEIEEKKVEAEYKQEDSPLTRKEVSSFLSSCFFVSMWAKSLPNPADVVPLSRVVAIWAARRFDVAEWLRSNKRGAQGVLSFVKTIVEWGNVSSSSSLSTSSASSSPTFPCSFVASWLESRPGIWLHRASHTSLDLEACELSLASLTLSPMPMELRTSTAVSDLLANAPQGLLRTCVRLGPRDWRLVAARREFRLHLANLREDENPNARRCTVGLHCVVLAKDPSSLKAVVKSLHHLCKSRRNSITGAPLTVQIEVEEGADSVRLLLMCADHNALLYFAMPLKAVQCSQT